MRSRAGAAARSMPEGSGCRHRAGLAEARRPQSAPCGWAGIGALSALPRSGGPDRTGRHGAAPGIGSVRPNPGLVATMVPVRHSRQTGGPADAAHRLPAPVTGVGPDRAGSAQGLEGRLQEEPRSRNSPAPTWPGRRARYRCQRRPPRRSAGRAASAESGPSFCVLPFAFSLDPMSLRKVGWGREIEPPRQDRCNRTHQTGCIWPSA